MARTQAEVLWHADAATTRELLDAYERLRHARERKIRTYYHDPVAFAHDCLSWEKGEGLAPYQEEILAALVDKGRVAQRGPRGLGKSSISAIALLWFSLTREAAGVDWKCLTTAGGWHQLETYLWPEIHRWVTRLRWDRIGLSPMRAGKELLRVQLNMTYGRAFAVASNHPQRIEGAHAQSVFVILDEAKIISDDVFDAIEGSFSGVGEGFVMASSTPGPPMGRFYDIHARKPGLTNWWVRHVTLYEAIHARRLRPEWARQQKLLWGRTSALYFNHVLGEFHADTETAIIPLAWVEAAIMRWKEHNLRASKGRDPFEPINRIGVDVAHFGADKTVIALTSPNRVHELHSAQGEDTVQTTGRVKGHLLEWPDAVAVIDADGLGVGVYDQLVAGGFRAEGFHAGAATKKTDASGLLRFRNVRAAAWYSLREMLDPARTAVLELPDNTTLIGDLTAVKRKNMVGRDLFQVESKDDLKKRLGRSPDFGDAVIMAYWQDRVKRRARGTFAGRAL